MDRAQQITTVDAVRCRGLTKDYGGGRGVFDFDLVVGPGEVFGLVGPNGAGKTTTIRLLMDLVRADRGTATVLGLDSRRDSVAVKRLVGYLPGELVRFPGVTAGYLVGLLAGLRGGVDEARIRRLADRLDLDLGRRYETLSHGNKQKVALVQAFMHAPRLLVLDEPTLGLDPLIQREFRAMLAEAVADGAAVFLSSHVLSEVELICDRIGMVRGGRLDRVGSLAELRALRLHHLEAILAGTVRVAEVAALPGISDVRVEPCEQGRRLTCEVRGAAVAPLLRVLTAADVVELDSHELSLEEVFLGAYGDLAPSATSGSGAGVGSDPDPGLRPGAGRPAASAAR